MIDYNCMVTKFDELLHKDKDMAALTEIENQLNITIGEIRNNHPKFSEASIKCYLYLFLELGSIIKHRHYYLIFYGVYTCYHNLDSTGKSLYYLLVLQNYSESLAGVEKDSFTTERNPINTYITFYKDQVLKTICEAPGELKILVALEPVETINPILAALHKTGQSYDIIKTIKTLREYNETNKLADYNIILLSANLFAESNDFLYEYDLLTKKYAASSFYLIIEPKKFQVLFREVKALPKIITANDSFIFSSLMMEIEKNKIMII